MKYLITLSLSLLCCLFSVQITNAQSLYKGYKDGQIYLKLKNNVDLVLPNYDGKTAAQYPADIDKILKKYGVQSVQKAFPHLNTIELNHSYCIKFADAADVNQMIEELKGIGIVDYAEKVPQYRVFLTPNDASYSQQWALPKINAANAWNISTGSRNVKIAIVDNAVMVNHADLSANKWVNPAEIAGNGIDDDGDGYIDDINGYDVADNNNNPAPPTSASPTNFEHGTHCAGIADAVTNNSIGVAGIGYSLSLIGVQCEPDNSSNPDQLSYAIQGVEYAVAAHADVISMSWGGGGYSQTEQNVFTAAWNQGIILVAAAGNDGLDETQYPAQYTHILSVGSTGTTDAKSSFSNYGNWIGVMAPGENIYSTVPASGGGSTYTNLSGTSMATPLVAGLCGLMKSYSPTSTNTQIITCLKNTCDNIDSHNASYVGKLGSGRINAYAALQCLLSAPITDFTADVTQTCSGLVHFTDLTAGGPTSWAWTFGDGGTSTLQNPAHLYTANGTYTVVLTATNSLGNNTKTKTAYITVNRPAAPSVTNASRCGTGTVVLTATVPTGDTVKWYSSATDTTPLATGSTYNASGLSNTTTYYAEDNVPGATYSVGPAAYNTVSDGGIFSNSTDQYLIFHALAPFTLKTVSVDATSSGTRVFALRDASGNTLQSVSVNVPTGVSTVTLNFSVPVGTGLQLGVNGTANLYRNNNGGLSYPYTAGGLVSIDSSSVGTNYYYYCYNWQIQANKCVSLRAPVVATINPTVTATTAATNVACYGTSTGSASVTAGGGTPGFTYAWSNSGTGASINNIANGTYTVTVTDTRGCSTTATATVTQPASALSATATSTNASCASSTGTAAVTVSGGTSGYAYHWSNNATTASLTGLSAGTYTVTVTDSHSCTTTASTTVTGGVGSLSLTPSHADVSCNGGNNGTAAITVTTGTSPYQYLWSTGSTASSLSNLAAGTYTVSVADAGGCSTTSTITVAQPTALSLSVTANAAGCGQANGSATAIPTGGTASYSYAWSNSGTTASLTGLTAGTYTVTVTDAHGCTTSNSTSVTSTGSLSLAPSHADVSCNGGNNGTATINVTTGTSPYVYLWSTGGTTASLNNLAAGTYTVSVEDANGCSTTSTISVAQPTALSLSVTANATGCGQANGSATAIPTGGTASYSYAWSNSGTTASLTGLAAGTYTVTVTDAHGCTTSNSTTVTSAGSLSLTPSHADVSCNGGNNGTATITVTTGTSPYVYLWSTGGTTASLSNLAAGTYTVSVEDANGCSTTSSVTVAQPTALNVSLTAIDAHCGLVNGAVTTAVTGGTSNYTYAWSNSAVTNDISTIPSGTYTVTVTDAHGCTTSVSTTVGNSAALSISSNISDVSCHGASNGSVQVVATTGTGPYQYNWSNGATGDNLSGLASGTYTVTTTDAVGCSVAQNITINQPAALTAQVSSLDASCGQNNGTAQALVTGGTSPYTYAWSTGATSLNIGNLAGGSYSVTVTDGHNCTSTASTTINATSSLATSISSTDVSCAGGNNGTAALQVLSGVQPYHYSWSTGGTISSAPNLSAGTYNVTVTDGNGCSATNSVTIAEPSALTVTPAVVDVACNGLADGNISLNVTGGTPGYSYSWSTGSTNNAISGLTAGSYNVVVTDNHNCQSSTTLQVNEPSALQLNETHQNVGCFGDQSGSALVAVSGGTAGYSLAWSTGATDTLLNGLAAGTYTVTATDANGCTNSSTVTITQPNAALADTVTVVNTQQGAATGAASIGIYGGTAPYMVAWSTGDSTASLNNLAEGTYSFSVTDANGCVDTGSAVIQSTVGIDQTEAGISADIYPNPTTGLLNIHLILPAKTDKLTIQVKDLLGRSLIVNEMDASKEIKSTLYLDSFASGVYIIEVHFGDNWLMRKIVLNK